MPVDGRQVVSEFQPTNYLLRWLLSGIAKALLQPRNTTLAGHGKHAASECGGNRRLSTNTEQKNLAMQLANAA